MTKTDTDRRKLIEIFDKIASLFNFSTKEIESAHKSNTGRLKRLLCSTIKQLSQREVRSFDKEDVTFMQNELGLETPESIMENKTETTLEDMVVEVILLQNASLFTIEKILALLASKMGADSEALEQEVKDMLNLLGSKRVSVITTNDGNTYSLNLTTKL
jgi:hypothetical protein